MEKKTTMDDINDQITHVIAELSNYAYNHKLMADPIICRVIDSLHDAEWETRRICKGK